MVKKPVPDWLNSSLWSTNPSPPRPPSPPPPDDVTTPSAAAATTTTTSNNSKPVVPKTAIKPPEVEIRDPLRDGSISSNNHEYNNGIASPSSSSTLEDVSRQSLLLQELTDFAQVKVLKVVVTYTGLRDYRITFQAFPPLGVAASLFVTKVRQYTSAYPKIKIMSVRIKHKDLPCNIHEQTISQLTKTFSADYLAPYLSQLALVMYNSTYPQIFEEKVAVHDIPSLKVVKAMKHVAAEGTTYFVTFEASLHDESKNIETFETQICVSTLFPPTTIEFNKVQIKHD